MRDYFNAGGIQRFTSFRLGPAPHGDGLHRRLATTSVCRRASGPACTVAVRSI
jgi:hypothetical protein